MVHGPAPCASRSRQRFSTPASRRTLSCVSWNSVEKAPSVKWAVGSAMCTAVMRQAARPRSKRWCYDDCSCSAPKWKVWWLGPHQNQIQRQCRICEIFTYKPHISFPLTHIRIKPQNSRFMMGSVMKMVQKVWVYEHDGSFFLITDITITLKKFWNALSPRWQNRSSLNVKLPWWIRRGSKAIIPFCASSGVGTTPRRHPGCTHPQRNPQIVHLEAVSRANPKIKIICKSHTQWRRSTWPCQNSITIWTRNNPFRGTRRARPERWRWAGWSELLAQQNCLLPSLPFWDEVLLQNRSIVPLHDNSWGGIIPVPA